MIYLFLLYLGNPWDAQSGKLKSNLRILLFYPRLIQVFELFEISLWKDFLMCLLQLFLCFIGKGN